MKFDSKMIDEIVTTDGLTRVTFQDGSQYTMRLPIEVLDAWVNAESVGRFFLSNVRGQYAGNKVRESHFGLAKK